MPILHLPLVGLVLALLTAMSYVLLVVVGHESKLFWLSGVLLIVAATYAAVRLFGELVALKTLEAGIHKAREGLMGPVVPVFEGWTTGGGSLTNSTRRSIPWA